MREDKSLDSRLIEYKQQQKILQEFQRKQVMIDSYLASLPSPHGESGVIGWYKRYATRMWYSKKIIYDLFNESYEGSDGTSILCDGIEIAVGAAALGTFFTVANDKDAHPVNEFASRIQEYLYIGIAFVVLVFLYDLITRTPYYVFWKPRQVLYVIAGIAFTFLSVSPANNGIVLSIVYWIVFPLLILNAIGLLEWLRPYM